MSHLIRINAFILLAAFGIAALAEERPRLDVSRAWFKPELLVNNQPEVCEPIFKSYTDYFVSPGASNPLEPISARYGEEHRPGALPNAIRELEWASIGEEEKGLRLAQWRQDGRYFGIVERSRAIGWRAPTYQYYLIDKPLSVTDVTDGTKERFGEGPISYLSKTDTPGVFDLIYESDARFGHFEQNAFVEVANVYASNHRVYLALTASNLSGPGPTVYLITSVITPRQVKLVCQFTTWPSATAIRSEAEKVSHYQDFEAVVVNIMGGGGDCGTLNAPARAMGDLREGLDALMVRPWTYSSSTEGYDFSSWGYSGIWNYRKYLEFNALLPKAQLGLADKYAKDYRLERDRARALANTGITAALARGFSHGRTEDEYQALHYAVRYASRDFIAWLVETGAVTSAQDSDGHTPLDYLTNFGGFVGYQKPAATSYGRQNRLLAQSHINSLVPLLTPLSEGQRQRASDEANRTAEALYRSGKIQAAYGAVKKALSLNANNERAWADLSLIALKLGNHGESAKAATYVIKNANSENERASAYFNLGLACQAEAKKGFHYTTIFYDGERYCEERWDRYQGPLYYYLKAYQTAPTKSRANAIVEFLEEVDDQRGKWLCKAEDPGANPRTVYVARNHVYFLTKNGAEVAYPRFARRERDKDTALVVTKKENFPLENGFGVSRWEVYVPYQGTLVLGEQLCSRFLPSLIDDGTELVELFIVGESKPVTLSSGTSKPIVLVLYGNKANWTIADDSRNIRAIYVHGEDATLRYPEKMPTVVHLDTKQAAYSEPWGSSFNAYTAMAFGLPIGALVDSTNRPQVRIDDAVLSGLPRCDNRVRANCRMH